MRWTLLFLAFCHTIVIDEKKGTYNASSPDELALVNAAKNLDLNSKDVIKMIICKFGMNYPEKWLFINYYVFVNLIVQGREWV